MLLPNFMPSAVQELLQTFQINGTHFYNLSALSHLREKGILPGTRSNDMSSLYDWPLEWEPKASLDSPFFSSLQNSDAENWQLLRKLGGHFLRRLIAALLAPNGNFPSLLLSTLWGIQGGFTSLCVQGIFGSGKTYCASLLLVLVSTVLQLPTVLTAEPNLPLATAAETISDLLRDAPAESRAAYAPGFWLMASLNSPQLMFSQLIARSSFKLTLPSCALSSPTARFLGISAVTIPNSALFLRPVGLLSTTNLNKGVTPASLSLPRVLPVHAYKSSPGTANKPAPGRVVIFCVNHYSSV